jgi:hypothetical protein
MILLNRLIRTDLVLLIVVTLLFILRANPWRDVLEGAGAVIFLISFGNHIGHYKRTKKFY